MNGAQERTRTSTTLRPLDPESSASASSATWAQMLTPSLYKIFRLLLLLIGPLPAMAQLIGNEAGWLRLLSCSYCGTRWRYRRITCPFCENGDEHRLEAITIEGEACLRIDTCSLCRGYLKTYVGQGDEALFLADWTSLHLDIIASDRGLRRLAASLYEL